MSLKTNKLEYLKHKNEIACINEPCGEITLFTEAVAQCHLRCAKCLDGKYEVIPKTARTFRSFYAKFDFKRLRCLTDSYSDIMNDMRND